MKRTDDTPPPKPTGAGPEGWQLGPDGTWHFVVDRPLPLELARAETLMAQRYGPNARAKRGGRW